jgi:acylphosphatase
MTEGTRCIRCYVSGRVQGVFFRAATQKRARELGITGYARNLRDGKVEVYACGYGEQIDVLQRWLAEGPPDAQVTRLECKPAPLTPFEAFTTR